MKKWGQRYLALNNSKSEEAKTTDKTQRLLKENKSLRIDIYIYIYIYIYSNNYSLKSVIVLCII